MTSRALWIVCALAACRGDGPSPRARVLAKIPASATTVFAASARALAHPRVRPLVDVLRGDIPAGFECVVDAALAGDQVAAGVEPSGDVTIAIETHAPVKCAAMSRIEERLWIATLGVPPAGTGVTNPRALPFLRDAPLALATTYDGARVLATAQPEPLAAWASFDERDAASATAFAKSLVESINATNANASFAGIARHISIDRQDTQVVAKLGAFPGDLAVPLRAALEAARGAKAARAFPCPTKEPGVTCQEIACTTPMSCAVERDEIRIAPFTSFLAELVGLRWEPVVSNGRVDGVRLRDDFSTYGLQSGDVLVSIDGRRVTAVEHVKEFLDAKAQKVSLIVSRGRRFGTIDYAQHQE